MSRTIGIMLLIGSGIGLAIGILSLLGFMALESTYSTDCTGFTGAVVQSDSDGEQYCSDLASMVALSVLSTAVFGICGVMGLIVGFIVITNNSRKPVVALVSNPPQQNHQQVMQISQKEYMDYQYQEQLQNSPVNIFQPPPSTPRRRLFDLLTNRGHNIGSFEHFEEKMNTEEGRRTFYVHAQSSSIPIGNWDEFNSKIQ